MSDRLAAEADTLARPPAFRATGKSDQSHPMVEAKRSSRFVEYAIVYLSIIVLVVIVGCAALAPWVSPYDPNAIALTNILKPPSAQHWFGTDQLGRDILSRTIWGARVSLVIALCAVLVAGAVGSAIGVAAGYLGGWFDRFFMWLADVQFSLPAIILALVLAGVVGQGFLTLVIIFSLSSWGRFARVVRSEALSLSKRDFTLLARLAGASPPRIMLTHILPNILNTFIVLVTLDIGLIIIFEATLSFLGLGVQPPDASWGTMMADGRGYLAQAWWITVLPGLALTATILCCNLLGDALRDKLSPTMQRKW